MLTSKDIVKNAHAANIVIPAFNVPYLPMVEPIIKAVVDQDCFAFIEVARLEWIKFQSGSLAAVMAEYKKWEQPDYVRLHLDHVPVIDEDELTVDYLPIIKEAIELGYHSVMIDGSRLDLAGNIAATRQVAEVAHAAGIPCEAELGAVMGHAAGPLPPYEELYASGMGFTDVDEAQQFVQETGCDWLSVAIGSIHGAVSGVSKDQKKVEAMLNLEHLEKLQQATGGIPFVLHGGSGVKQDYLLAAIKQGIAKVNIGTEIRQAYEAALRETGSIAEAQEATFQRTAWLIKDYFGLAGTRRLATG
ncbi:MAG: class II fructose-bisphosphate aldolase [Anaerolineae bacterium]|nr:class II fructose-bisphosphate aldolase [Anaerolineae bacterium]MCB9106741.1 class II fructose-bisphosphate aldolase [Anaerolineales bacterium]